MATRVRKTATAVPVKEDKKAGVHDQGLYSFSERQIVHYATAVNLERSVPDLYDGLKPVHRRILWSAYHVAKNSGEPVKAATIVGDVLGKYHPKGDGSVYGAMVTLVQGQLPTMFGDGNFGTLVDPPAAYRYTNAKLSDYGALMFDPDYVNAEVTMFVPNFDDRQVEPVTLPALLPNVLLNSNEGIGVGVTTNLPSFTMDSVCEVMHRLLSGEKLAAKDFAAILKPELKWGGRLVRSRENNAAWLNLFDGPTGAVQYTADLDIDEERKRVVIDNWPPGLVPDNFVKKVRALPECEDVYNSGGTTQYTATIKKGHNLPQFQAFAKKVQRIATIKKSYRLNVTKRSAKTDDGVTTYQTEFLSMSIPDIMIAWLRMRLDLEARSLAYRMRKQQRLIDRSKLLIYAASIKDVIRSAWDAKDDIAYLVKNTELTAEQATDLLELKLKQLSRLDQDRITATLKEQEAHQLQLEKWQKRPKAKIREEIADLGKRIFWRYNPDLEASDAVKESRARRKKKRGA